MKIKILSQICLYVAISAILTFGLLIAKVTVAIAGQVTFVKEYTYQASEADSKLSCRAIAMEQAKRLLLEELGTYLETKTEVKNYQLARDQITVLSAGIVRTEVVDEKWDGKTYWLKAKIAADPSEVSKSIEALRKDVEKSNDLREARTKTTELLKQADRLNKELRAVKTDATEAKQREYRDVINGIYAWDSFEKGYSLYLSANYVEAVKMFDNAIEFSSTYALPYTYRGFTYIKLGLNKEAITDMSKVADMYPNDANAYANRGVVYMQMRNYDAAYVDLKKSVELKSRDAVVYGSLGTIAMNWNKMSEAIRLCSFAIQLDPDQSSFYIVRGYAYLKTGSRQKGIDDMRTAARLGDDYGIKILKEQGIDR